METIYKQIISFYSTSIYNVSGMRMRILCVKFWSLTIIIRRVDPIQRKKFNSCSFCSSNYADGTCTNYFQVNPVEEPIVVDTMNHSQQLTCNCILQLKDIISELFSSLVTASSHTPGVLPVSTRVSYRIFFGGENTDVTKGCMHVSVHLLGF